MQTCSFRAVADGTTMSLSCPSVRDGQAVLGNVLLITACVQGSFIILPGSQTNWGHPNATSLDFLCHAYCNSTAPAPGTVRQVGR